jgi:hypothetical protein
MILDNLEKLARAATPAETFTDPRFIAFRNACSPEVVLALVECVRAADAMHTEYDQDLYTTATNKAYKAARARMEEICLT